jgi:hypothetical protein
MEKKKHSMVLELALVITLGLLLLPGVAGQEPPVDEEEKGCIAYAYTQSENHFFLLKDNASMFGDVLRVVHNCDDLRVYADGFFLASSGQNFTFSLEAGIHNLSFQSSTFNESFSNVMFYPDRLNWEFDFIELQESKPQFIDIELSELRTNWAVGVGIVVVWVLTTYVYWSLISSYIDRNFVEEVTQ